MFPTKRMRRLRRTEKLRAMVGEVDLKKDDLIYPLFIQENLKEKEEITSMPFQFRLPLAEVRDEVLELVSLGVPAVILFGIPERKDEDGSEAYNPKGVIQRA
ncbi:MAG: porphobilinogen synthase, partial [Candidatus Hydrothermarchaeaceae archaeon]